MYAKWGDALNELSLTDTQKLVREALHIAGKLDAGSGAPFHVLYQTVRPVVRKKVKSAGS
jgi:hypothetical protein